MTAQEALAAVEREILNLLPNGWRTCRVCAWSWQESEEVNHKPRCALPVLRAALRPPAAGDRELWARLWKVTHDWDGDLLPDADLVAARVLAQALADAEARGRAAEREARR